MKVCRSGTTVCSRASARASSSEGPTSRSAASAATAIELLEGVGERQPASGEQDREVVEDVGGLLAHARVGLLARRARDLLGLLLDLRAYQLGVLQERGGVGARRSVARRQRRAALRDRALERGQRLVRRGLLRVPAKEA